ncbi:hypothetical protein GCM10022243_34150 [Saccharothrix violaceirubra]|uniref:Uncharacterized protein n=1 Tax=Saccharothrix violaceirubra TaxID=413306 RepID=A0A7W7WXC8_9PSEU|nr:hypothetical protein [Saccharothrix violaceirubra]MBB4966468.1 hypothetical protein [Saccharothrix violaceirubra]
MSADRGVEELLSAALGGPDAVTVRAALAGMVAALRSAGHADPAVVAAADRLAGLGSGGLAPGGLAPGGLGAIGQGSVGSGPGGQEAVGPGQGASGSGGPVERVAAGPPVGEFAADPDVATWLGATTLDALTGAPTEAQAWVRLWLAFLRLPPDLAETWRERVRSSRTGDAGAWQAVAGGDESLVDPLPEAGVTGLRESPDAAVHPWAADVLPERFATLRTLVGQVLTMVERDPGLHHALESRRRQDFHSLGDPANLRDFQRDAANRLGYLAAAPPGSVRELRELSLVDELLCSVVHVPPAHPESWWGRLARRSRALVAEAAAALRERGEDVEVRVVPPGPYDAQRPWIGRNNLSCPVPGRPPSQILACLRVYLRAGEEEYPGRVVYVRDDR